MPNLHRGLASIARAAAPAAARAAARGLPGARSRLAVRGPRRVRPFVGVIALPGLLLSCSPQEQESTRPDDADPTVSIAAPAAGAWVADTVRVSVTAEDAGGIHCVSLLVDSLGCATRYASPWIFLWPTGGLADSSRHALQAEAIDRSGHRALSEPIAVRVRRNAPPAVRIVSPRADQYLSLDDSLAAWRCSAIDPEEGELDGSRIGWRIDGETLAASGAAIPPPPLSPGPHRISALARDRWGSAGETSLRVTAFRYPSGEDPASILEAWALALRARDASRAVALLHPEYRSFAPGRIGIAWGERAAEEEALARLLDADRLESLVVGSPNGSAEIFRLGETEIAKLEWRDLTILARLVCDGAKDAIGREWRVEGSLARIYLRRDAQSAGAWRIATWWDLHGSAPARSGGPSWSALKEAARRDRLCD